MEENERLNDDGSRNEFPTDPEAIKGIAMMLSCCDYKKCCKKYKKGKRCKKCPDR